MPKLRCRSCCGKLGLGIVSARVYCPDKWWWRIYRFCSVKCRDTFLARKAEELQRKRFVAALYRPP